MPTNQWVLPLFVEGNAPTPSAILKIRQISIISEQHKFYRDRDNRKRKETIQDSSAKRLQNAHLNPQRAYRMMKVRGGLFVKTKSNRGCNYSAPVLDEEYYFINRIAKGTRK